FNMTRALPKPSGPWSVGCFDVTTKCGEDRCLFRLYYPSKEINPDSMQQPLWLPENEYAAGFTNFLKVPSLTRVFGWIFSTSRIPASWKTDLVMPSGVQKLPVILFSHGLGANKTTYSNICTELASHGTLVAAVEHSDKSASATYYLEENLGGEFEKKWIEFLRVSGGEPVEQQIRNKQVRHRADECCRILDCLQNLNDGNLKTVEGNENLNQFKGNLDLDKCGILGHSFGGATTVTSLSMDSRFKVGIALDSWMYPLDKDIYCSVNSVPLLFINSESFQWPSNIANMRKLDLDTFNIPAERRIITLSNSTHHSQCDFPLLLKYHFLSKSLGLAGTADPLSVSQLNNSIILAFIGTHLGLEFGKDLTELINANKETIIRGSNVQVDEEKV
uniref:1-alkyl-2-acetylglycerophosphocholine esterase n=1 Tax=Ciona savignyi TaxID=51511 RepID=H2ZF45_CIOSA